ncbi:putative Zn-dependent protease-like protein [Synechococcus sp. PCC 6312]|nr:putative Zn-dependent protease-like protein [Synechococcus sp. PCC 6312]
MTPLAAPVLAPPLEAPDLAQALTQINTQAEWISLRYVQEQTTTRSVRDGNPQVNHHDLSAGVMIEVLVNGQLGYGAGNRLDRESLQQAADRAYQQALRASQWSLSPVSVAIRPAVVGEYRGYGQDALGALGPGEINELLQKICQTLKVSEKIVQTTALMQTVATTSHWVSSNGGNIRQDVLQAITHYAATAQDGANIQQRTDNGMFARCYQAGLEVLAAELVLERAAKIGSQALELLTAAECPTTTTNLVLAPDQMMLQIHESIGHPLELDRILGDERNYAGSSFVKLEDFGQLVYGSPLLNVTFDPTVPTELASYGFDDGGVPAQREYLIKEGILLRGLGSAESQLRSGVPGVANLRACSWNRPPIDRMANLNLEPGSRSWQEIIGNIEQGIYMESNRSWSIDDYRLKFQFGCEYAREINNGQLGQVLRNPNYRGATPNFWGNLIAVGDQSTLGIFGTPYCGKGEPNQAIRVGHASPVCAFANIEVFGGH